MRKLGVWLDDRPWVAFKVAKKNMFLRMSDFILYKTNPHSQEIHNRAWGQAIIYFKTKRFSFTFIHLSYLSVQTRKTNTTYSEVLSADFSDVHCQDKQICGLCHVDNPIRYIIVICRAAALTSKGFQPHPLNLKSRQIQVWITLYH